MALPKRSEHPPPFNLLIQYVAEFSSTHSRQPVPATPVRLADGTLQLVKIPTGKEPTDMAAWIKRHTLTLETPMHARDCRGERFLLRQYTIAQTFLKEHLVAPSYALQTPPATREFVALLRHTNALQLRALEADDDEEYPSLPRRIGLFDTTENRLDPLGPATLPLSAINPAYTLTMQIEERKRWEQTAWQNYNRSTQELRAMGLPSRFQLEHSWGSRAVSHIEEKYSAEVNQVVLAFYYLLGLTLGTWIRDDFYALADRFISATPVKTDWGSVSAWHYTYNTQAFVQEMQDTLIRLSSTYPDKPLEPVLTEIADLAYLFFASAGTNPASVAIPTLLTRITQPMLISGSQPAQAHT